MKTRIVVVVILVITLLLASWAIALARTSQHGDPISYQVETGSVTGKGYQLIYLTWQVNGALRGGGYSLLVPATPALTGSGCCCTYLPCVLGK